MESKKTKNNNESLKWLEISDKLSRSRFASRAKTIDEESRFPKENYEDLKETGLLALSVPKEYGGIGADALTYVKVLSNIARGCASTGLTFNMHSAVVDFMKQLASPEQQEEYFTKVVKDGAIFASITSEPGSSFRDKLSVRTSIRKFEESKFKIQGKKHFCSLSTGADFYFTWSFLDGSENLKDGLYNVMIPSSREGIEILDDWNTIGMRGTASNSVIFNDVEVSKEEVIGVPGSILGKDMSMWSLGYTAVYIGIAEAAYEFTLNYAKNKKSGLGVPLPELERTQRQIGEMSMILENARRAAEKLGMLRGNMDKMELTFMLNQAKYLATEAARELAERGIRFCGGLGLQRDLPLERHLRDSIAGIVMPPSNDRCLETVGQIALGLDAKTLDFQ